MTQCSGCHEDDFDDFYTIDQFSSFGSSGDSFSETDVCDPCHSPDGAYDGVDDPVIGAKPNWEEGVYNGSLRTDKKEWCVGCHDSDPARIHNVDAPDVSLFWTF